MKGYNVVSYNVKGLYNPIKRQKIMDQLKNMHSDIVYLQETHLSDDEHKKLSKSWASQVFYSSYSSGHKRGVAILLHRSVQFCLDSVFKDKEGRYIIVNGTIDGVWVTMCNVYAPNDNKPQFIKNIFSVIIERAKGLLLVGGDFNCSLSLLLDKNPPSSSPQTSMAKALKNVCEELEFLDIWRFLHPKQRDYTFFSHPHGTYSRIDYFFMPKSEVYRARECEIHNISLSDHAPVSLIWEVGQRPSCSRWRLNTSLLGRPEIKTYIRHEFEQYLEINDKPDTSPITLWEAAKAVLRGKIISCSSTLKKRRIEKQNKLEQKIKILEIQHKQNPTTENLKQLKEVRRELDDLLTEKVERNLRFLKQKFYEHGSRANRLLASQLRKKIGLNIVKKIKTNSADKPFLYKPAEISETFAAFYKNLYSDTDICSEPEQIKSYLDKINLPKMDILTSNMIDNPITKEEIIEAIKKLKNNKSPGTDGYTNEFYKAFSDIISPLLERTYAHIMETGKMPYSWKEAIISVIHKEGKDPTDCASYRPVALLNTDCKLLTSILTRRIERIVVHLINPDQTGFVIGRHLQDNIRRLLNIMTYSSSQQLPCMALALDAEKAFDRVSWPFLFKVLEKFGFGPKFVKWIQLLYSGPQSMVRVNGCLSQPFQLSRGTRQGCPLSPLLFAMSIEPLAQAIRDNLQIKGIDIDNYVHKLSLYADDVLVYVSDPLSSVPILMEEIKQYGNLSGYKINVNKTEALALNTHISPHIKASFHFRWPREGITYLGAKIPPNSDKLYEVNYIKLIKKITSDLDRWSMLPLSMAGRIESIRMNILPRLMFLFQVLPLTPPRSMFTLLDRLTSRFIWQGRRPRVRYKVLQLQKSQGGWALPNFRYYWLACQLRAMTVWISDRSDTGWLEIEKTNFSRVPLSAIPFHEEKSCNSRSGRWTMTTLLAWKEVQRSFGLLTGDSALSDISCLKKFMPLQLDSGFQRWRLYNLRFIHQLLVGTTLKTFEQLELEFGLPRADFFRYLQIRNFLLKHPNSKEILNPLSPVEQYFKRIQLNEKAGKPVSTLYRALSDMKKDNIEHIRHKWENEFNKEINEEAWRNIFIDLHKVTNSVNWREFSWKCSIRFFRSPVLVSKINLNQTAYCWRDCGEALANHTHIFWTCPKLTGFWNEVFDIAEKALVIKLNRDPMMAILGANMKEVKSKEGKYLLQILFVAAKKAITKNWLQREPPTCNKWLSLIKEIYVMEKITYTLRLEHASFKKRWAAWLEGMALDWD